VPWLSLANTGSIDLADGDKARSRAISGRRPGHCRRLGRRAADAGSERAPHATGPALDIASRVVTSGPAVAAALAATRARTDATVNADSAAACGRSLKAVEMVETCAGSVDAMFGLGRFSGSGDPPLVSTHAKVLVSGGSSVCRLNGISALGLPGSAGSPLFGGHFRRVLAERGAKRLSRYPQEPALLIQFRTENHRSLRDEQVLSLVSSREIEGSTFKHPGIDESLLTVLAIYGANASGKSNVLAAIAFMRGAIVNSHREWEPTEGVPRDPFLLSSKVSDKSTYEADVLVGGIRYRYGFSVSSARVEDEWLFSWPKGKKATLLERTGDVFDFGKTFRGENEAIRELTRINSLFLSAAAQNNHPLLLPIFEFFAGMRISMRRSSLAWRATMSPAGVRSLNEQTMQEPILQLLRSADTGIVGLKVEEEERGIRADGRPFKRTSVLLNHRGENNGAWWLPLESESEGTIALLQLAPRILDALNTGGVMCVDELEASLHPALATRLVGLFNERSTNPHGAQLIFATHDITLLGSLTDSPPLHRDQIWFTEKSEAGVTRLYPLTDFHPRREENLERGYLQGRYGAVPYLSDLVPSSKVKKED